MEAPAATFFVPDSAASAIADAWSARSMELIVLPTEKCNFRCTYCYETFALGRMSGAIVGGIAKLLEVRVPELDVLSLSWFGGEPMLALPLVIELSGHAQQLCQTSGCTFHSGMTTNGWHLDRPTLEQLLDVGVNSFQISLDGDEEAHNRTRLLANGAGTFERIWSNLLSLRAVERPFSITLRLHVSPSNQESLSRLLTRIEQEFGTDRRYRVFFHQISNLGGPHAGSIQKFASGQYESVVRTLTGNVRSWGATASNEVELRENHTVCYAAKPNSLVVRSNGRLAKCTVAFEDPRNDVGYIDPTGQLHINDQNFQLWLEAFRNLDWNQLSCPLPHLDKLAAQIVSAKSIPVVVY